MSTNEIQRASQNSSQEAERLAREISERHFLRPDGNYLGTPIFLYVDDVMAVGRAHTAHDWVGDIDISDLYYNAPMLASDAY